MRIESSLSIITLCVVIMAFSAAVSAETHWNLQAVDSMGVGTWTDSPSYPVTVTGVILNNHEEMLDPTADYKWAPWSFDMGGEWQIFVQPVDPADYAGTALYMGQNYGNTTRNNPVFSYSNEEWEAELNRLNYDNGDPLTGRLFRKGDLVQVVAPNVGFYGGKTNINEAHDNDPSMDFNITLIDADYGLPNPEEITLTSLFVDPDTAGYDSDYPLFDSSRLSGGEYYQGRRVLLNGLTLTDSSGWDQEEWDDRICTVAGVDQTDFKLRMPRGLIVDLNDPPAGEFQAIGILNQESRSLGDGRYGYELFVSEVWLPGDVNGDGFVGGTDLNTIISNWGLNGASRSQGDLTGEGDVAGSDYNQVLGHWGEGTPPEPPYTTPEPTTLILLSTGILALLRHKKRSGTL